MGHHLNVVPYLKKILIRGLRGVKYKKNQVLGHFFGNRSLQVSNFLHDVRVH